MHYCVTVAVPGVFDGVDLQGAVRVQMEPHRENEWDYYRVGGRWIDYWTLKPGAERGPLDHDTPTRDDGRTHSDCARLCDIEAESLTAPYSWVDLEGGWHTKWLGPDGSGSNDVKTWEYDDDLHVAAYLAWLQTLDPKTWLVNVDCHN